MWTPTPRKAQTTIPCKKCQTPLEVQRSCDHVFLHCHICSKDIPLREYRNEMDEALLQFLENLPCDRI